jgi:hypothetical protein
MIPHPTIAVKPREVMISAAACRAESWPFGERLGDLARRRELPYRLAGPADPYFRHRALPAAAVPFRTFRESLDFTGIAGSSVSLATPPERHLFIPSAFAKPKFDFPRGRQ